jgi:hypothetical protein
VHTGSVRTLSATNEKELALVISVLHDCWLNLPDATTDRHGDVVVLGGAACDPSRRRVARRVGPFERFSPLHARVVLTIAGVRSISLADDAKCGEISVRRLAWDPTASKMTIEGNIPVVMVLVVKGIDVNLEISDELRARSERWGFVRRS